MNNKRLFLESYAKLPDKRTIRRYITAIVLLVTVLNYGMLYLYKAEVYSSSTPYLFSVVCKIIIVFDLFSAIFYCIPDKMNKIIYLYTAVSFWGSSIYYMFLSTNIFLYEYDSDSAHLRILISYIIYMFIVMAVIFNIKNKTKSKYVRNPVNKRFVSIFTTFCVAIGTLLGKHTVIPLQLVFLAMAYVYIPAICGFHQFYLIIKNRR
ncbi:MAG: hypothetical protein ABRQ27_11645 [Clostridiaceae bacterium]